MSDTTLPTDRFSRELRAALDNPGAIGAGSTVHAQDFYGNSETWVLQTFRADGRETVFVQRNSVEGGMRLVLPPEVTAALARQRDQVITRARRRAARSAAATRQELGIRPAFLKKKAAR